MRRRILDVRTSLRIPVPPSDRTKLIGLYVARIERGDLLEARTREAEAAHRLRRVGGSRLALADALEDAQAAFDEAAAARTVVEERIARVRAGADPEARAWTEAQVAEAERRAAVIPRLRDGLRDLRRIERQLMAGDDDMARLVLAGDLTAAVSISRHEAARRASARLPDA